MRQTSIAAALLAPLALASGPAAAQDGTFRPIATAPAATPSAAAARSRAAATRDEERRRRRVDFLDGSSIQAQSEWLARRNGIGMHLLTSGDSRTSYTLVRRTVASRPEVHARWDDIVIVRGGSGAIEMGDSLAGSTLRAPGERVGGTLVTPQRIVLRAGDIVRIPAAVPHAFVVSGTAPLEYVLIKQRRQELPVRWFGQER